MSRELSFDRDEILNKVMLLFWEKGYESTSMGDIMEVTGLLKGSLYNAFKSKENLFSLCLENYGIRSKSFFLKETDEPIVYIKTFFTRLVNEGAKKDSIGCLIMNSCLEFSGQNSSIALQNEKLFKAVENNMVNVAMAINELKTLDVEPRVLANDLVVAAFSIREFSKFKKDKKFLKQIANNVLKHFSESI